MKKVILVTLVALSLFVFVSCAETNELESLEQTSQLIQELEKSSLGYFGELDTESNETEESIPTRTGKDEIGGDETEEDDDIDLDTAGN